MKKTIKDISKELGISQATISRVLNNSGYYSKEVGNKVRKYVEETGFVYNQSAKKLRSNQSKTVGLIVPNISNEFFSKAALICDNFFSRWEYSLYICNTESDEDKEKRSFINLASQGVDGILCSAFGSSLDESFTNYEIPIVAFDRPFNKKIPATRIYSNEYELGKQVAEKLLSSGCKNIRVLVPYDYKKDLEFDRKEDSKNDFVTRLNGFYYTLKKINPDLSPADIMIQMKQYSGMEAEIAKDTILKTFQQNTNIDGLFCTSDILAYGAIQALNELNILVPGQVKVIGFDNSLYSSLSSLPITTVDRNLDAIVSTACVKLLEKIESKDKFKDETFFIDGKLIERNTS